MKPIPLYVCFFCLLLQAKLSSGQIAIVCKGTSNFTISYNRSSIDIQDSVQQRGKGYYKDNWNVLYGLAYKLPNSPLFAQLLIGFHPFRRKDNDSIYSADNPYGTYQEWHHKRNDWSLGMLLGKQYRFDRFLIIPEIGLIGRFFGKHKYDFDARSYFPNGELRYVTNSNFIQEGGYTLSFNVGSELQYKLTKNLFIGIDLKFQYDFNFENYKRYIETSITEVATNTTERHDSELRYKQFRTYFDFIPWFTIRYDLIQKKNNK